MQGLSGDDTINRTGIEADIDSYGRRHSNHLWEVGGYDEIPGRKFFAMPSQLHHQYGEGDQNEGADNLFRKRERDDDRERKISNGETALCKLHFKRKGAQILVLERRETSNYTAGAVIELASEPWYDYTAEGEYIL